MNKIYIDAQQLLEDSFRLAKAIYDSNWHPNHLLAIWRGGTPIGIAIHEYFRYLDKEVHDGVVQVRSYAGVGKRQCEVRISDISEFANGLSRDGKLLIVDDVWETGHTVNLLLQKLKKTAGTDMPPEIRVACPWYKPSHSQYRSKPDFYLHTTTDWLVFPHELQDLGRQELEAHKPAIAKYVQS